MKKISFFPCMNQFSYVYLQELKSNLNLLITKNPKKEKGE